MNTMNEHPLTEAEAERIWDGNAPSHVDFGGWTPKSQGGIAAALRAAFDEGREHERTHADDGWEPLRDGELRVGDEAQWSRGDLARIGVVARVDEDGNPRTAEDTLIGIRRGGTWHVRRAPVTWYRLPIKHPAHITDVTWAESGDACAHMALDRHGWWRGVDQDGDIRQWHARDIPACTLDGTRLVRDGVFEDGEPRFREEAGE